MVGCIHRLFQSSDFSPAPLYLPWLDGDKSAYEAVIEDVLEPGKQWRVRYQASFWKACSSSLDLQLHPKEIVRVVGRHNLTLIIQPQ